MRIAIAEIAQETDSFSPMVADLKDFEAFGLFHGAEILEKMRNVGPLGGMFQVAAEQNEAVEWLPLVRAWAGAGGTITAETLDDLTERLVSGLKQSLPVDAIFLALHGAAASENEDDVEGHVLSAVREVVGEQVPVIVSLDHHANITQRMVRHSSVLIGHETQPHDPVDTGRKTARVMFQMLNGGLKPTVAWRKIPMITPQDFFLTSHGPMREWFELAREMERRPGVIDVSPYPMQPWLDVAEGGWAVVVHTDNNPQLAESLAEESAAKAWNLRDQFWVSERVAAADAVRQAVAADKGLIILSDTGDSVYGGAPGDSTCILRELVNQEIPCIALVPVVDPAVVDRAMSAGVGGHITVDLGAKLDNVFSQPVRITGRVAAVSNGVTLELEDRGACDIGRTALLEVGQVRIVVLAQRTFAINHPTLYTHLGLDIAVAKMVVLKTASNFQFFSRWCGPDPSRQPRHDPIRFEGIRLEANPAPMYPLDQG